MPVLSDQISRLRKLYRYTTMGMVSYDIPLCPAESACAKSLAQMNVRLRWYQVFSYGLTAKSFHLFVEHVHAATRRTFQVQ